MSTNDYVRRRLTHSLEASVIGERMGRVIAKEIWRRLPDGKGSTDSIGKIVAAACLLHDVGNPPFGHEGEMAIREWADSLSGDGDDNQDSPDCQGFDGNAQGFRIAVRLQSHGLPYGRNLTSATLSTFLKYPVLSPEITRPDNRRKRGKFSVFRSEGSQFDMVAANVGLAHGQRHPLGYVVEAADDIANRLCDLEDAIKTGLVQMSAVDEMLQKCGVAGELAIGFYHRRLKDIAKAGMASNADRFDSAMKHFKVRVIIEMAKACERVFIREVTKIEAGSFEGSLIEASDWAEVYRAIEELERAEVFRHQDIVTVEVAGTSAMSHLLGQLMRAVIDDSKLQDIIPHPPRVNSEPVFADHDMHRVVDFVSGMTDRYTMSLYRKLVGIEC